ncbi:HSF-type DNA-binding-domain-containing protein [Mrakia frigida]|uniref:heat shock factor family protein n=1 Tax=Mrakia frigida TaxID=29902 RepID=UPI003FCBF342
MDSYDAFLQSQCHGLLQQPVSPPQYTHDCEEPTQQQSRYVQLPSTSFYTNPQSYEPTTWNEPEAAGGCFQVQDFSDVNVGGGGPSTNDLEVDFGDVVFSPPASSPRQSTRALKIEPGLYHESNESDEDLSPMEGVSGFLGEETAFVSKLYHIATHPEYAHYLRWSQDGSAFCLLNAEKFATKVLPRFFRHSKVNSFLRQLRLYGFQRVSVVISLDPSDSFTSASPKLRRHSLLATRNDPSFELSDSASWESSSLPNGGDWPTRKVTACGFTHVNFNRDNPSLLKLLHPKTQVLKKPRNRSLAAKKAAAASREEEASRTGRGRKTSS